MVESNPRLKTVPVAGWKPVTQQQRSITVKRPMKPEKKCPSCGSTRLEPGTIQTAGRVNFRPENTKFFTLGTGDVPIEANICMECGAMLLVGDLTKATKLVG
jgi:hypothetical protein